MTTADATQARSSPGNSGGWQTIGHAAARLYLRRAHEAGRVAHAYLITGPDQVGKRTLAMDLARLVNCTPAQDMFGDDAPPPCGSCAPCDRISRNVHADIKVIDPHTPIRGLSSGTRESTPEQDAARTLISIGHIREMQHDVSLNPFEGGRRVVIFDGADRMSPDGAGWNALLKTLEEPPEKVVIVLLAPSADSLPQTVVSRCQLIELHAVPNEEIERGLIERGGADPETAAQLARLAGGCPGRAFAALNDETTLDRYRQAVLRVLVTSAGDVEERFRYANEMAREFGRNRELVSRELELWTSIWRDILLLKHGAADSVANITWTGSLSDAAAAVNADDPRQAIEAIAKAADGLRRNGMPRVVLEVLMLELPVIPPEIVEAIELGEADEPSDGGWDDPAS
ncbi:MAG: DNA polymerase III subunit delta' [Dehalococcoidia bacterium]|jgi:DNA polymerase-3 subunit delta'|nr:DNA polymerase III subunit delta' [Dehalococcoidia bacterium]